MKVRSIDEKKRHAGYQKKSDDIQRELGRKGRKIWATQVEHDKIKKLLVKMRAE